MVSALDKMHCLGCGRLVEPTRTPGHVEEGVVFEAPGWYGGCDGQNGCWWHCEDEGEPPTVRSVLDGSFAYTDEPQQHLALVLARAVGPRNDA
jgi:hypothetical protein